MQTAAPKISGKLWFQKYALQAAVGIQTAVPKVSVMQTAVPKINGKLWSQIYVVQTAESMQTAVPTGKSYATGGSNDKWQTVVPKRCVANCGSKDTWYANGGPLPSPRSRLPPLSLQVPLPPPLSQVPPAPPLHPSTSSIQAPPPSSTSLLPGPGCLPLPPSPSSILLSPKSRRCKFFRPWSSHLRLDRTISTPELGPGGTREALRIIFRLPTF